MPPFYTSLRSGGSVSRWRADEGLRAHRQALRFRYLSGLVLEPDRQSRPMELPRARPPRKVRLRITLRSEVGCPAWRRIYRRAWQPTVASPPIQLRGSSVCMSVRVSMDFMPVSLHQVRYIHRSADPIHPTPVAYIGKSDPERPIDGPLYRACSIKIRISSPRAISFTAICLPGWASRELSIRPPPSDRSRASLPLHVHTNLPEASLT